MNRTSLIAIATLGLSAVATLASAQSSQGSLGLGATVGLYFPSSTRVKNALGDDLLNYGIGGTGTSRPSNGSLTPNLSLLTGSSNGDHLFIASFTEGYEYHLGSSSTTSQLIPYVRPFAGLSYFDFGITEDTGRIGIKRVGYTYGLEVGAVISQRIRLSAAYNIYSSESSFNFNGFLLSLSYTIW